MTLSAPERPIERSADDKLERSAFIERLASSLIDKDTGKATGVVVGITGPWGSGKSSILNLLKESIKTNYPDTLIVRFDPWLVAGRNDLIAEFLKELMGSISSDQTRFKKFKKAGTAIAEYGAHLAPAANYWMPGVGAVFSGILRAISRFLSGKKESLIDLRLQVMNELSQAPAPVIVLIDEIDRVEDEEIRTVAQLVRSVADFPAISYVLAYDADRVAQALGSGTTAARRKEHGRSYLEKIVQLEIPLPVTFDDEITKLISADLKSLQNALSLPEFFDTNERYQRLMQHLAGDVIRTPRDVRRLVGNYHVLRGMLKDEIDWVDLLGYSALLVKAPETVRAMRNEPDDFLDSPTSARGLARYFAREKQTPEDKLDLLIPQSEQSLGIKNLVSFLLPSLSKDDSEPATHSDAFQQRRPFLTTLRLGLLPGAFSRDDIQRILKSPGDEVEHQLRTAFQNGNIGQLVDRLDELYPGLSPSNHVVFWKAIASFVRKPDDKWLTSYDPMRDVTRNFAEILFDSVRRVEGFRPEAARIFTNLRNTKASELTAFWLRSHIFVYGLYGQEKGSGRAWFLSEEQTKALAHEMSHDWRLQHLSGKLLQCSWDMQPVYTMIDLGVWDDACRRQLDNETADRRALIGFTILLFGAAYTNSRETIEKMCDYDLYIRHVKALLESPDVGEIHETALVSLKKALGDYY
ncbi:MAG: hypothetical protein QOF14_247 [Hyphomicrobiales bacterium]|jgi:energy-coupling factor transporter ATP-binding protein EcfA2|nr:hypothetical protein [Hyphomicrobiales bacterium]